MRRDEIIAANPLEMFLTNRGFELRPSGSNFVTNACPVSQHKKYHRPVTVDVEKQLWHCNDCEAGGTVIDWESLEKKCDIAEAMRILGGGRSNGSEPIAVYDYTDQAGKLLYQVCRCAGKNFPVRRPNGKGGHAWGLGDVKRVLYRLPEVISSQTVLTAEGEKDCDNLTKLGFTATCNPGGALKWRDSYSETLQGKDGIVFLGPWRRK